MTDSKPTGAPTSRPGDAGVRSPVQLGPGDLLVFAALVMLGIVHLDLPLGGDQALFTVFAMELQQGAVLYRDIWDLKAPMIFLFYLVGGAFLGFDAVGIHGAEMLYLLGFAACLRGTLVSYFRNAWALRLAILLFFGFYYTVSDSFHRAQVEGLVGFPILLFLWLVARNPSLLNRGDTLAAGVLAAIVVLFKPLLVLVLVAILISTWCATGTRRPSDLVHLRRFLGPFGLGLLLPLLGVLLYFAHHDTLSLFLWTMIGFRSRLMLEAPMQNPIELILGLRWFVLSFAPLIGLGILGVMAGNRRRWDRMTSGLVAWFFSALLVVLVQRLSWAWEYHYLLPLPPLAILAARAIDHLWAQARTVSARAQKGAWQWAIALALVFFLATPVATIVQRLAARIHPSLALTALASSPRATYDRQVADDVRFLLEPSSLPGRIFVFGDPLVYLKSGRRPASSISGWSTRFLFEHQWEQLRTELAVSNPAYIFVASRYRRIPLQSPATFQWIESTYRRLEPSVLGSWYVARKPQTASNENPRPGSRPDTKADGS